MTTMNAVLAARPGTPDVLVPQELPIPEPGRGEVRLRVTAAAVNFSDVMRRRASPYPFPTAFPYHPGGEVAGVVDAHGPGVTEPPLGTPVFAVVGAGGETGYAQYTLCAADRAFPIPPTLAPEQAAGLVIAGVTAVAMAREFARIQPEDTVVVPAAAGGVGSLLVQVAKVLGAGTVIALASTETKRQHALDLGADAAFDPRAPDLTERVMAQAPQGVDVLFDMEGGPSLDQRLRWLAPFGRAVVYGAASDEPRRLSGETLDHWLSTPALNQSVVAFNLGSLFGHRPPWARAAVGSLMGWLLEGTVKLPVGHVLPLHRAAEAHRLLEGRATSGKIVLDPWPKSKVVAEHPFYRFELSHDGDVLAFRWTEASAEMTPDGFRDSLVHYADVAGRYRPRGLLIDVRAFRYAGPGIDEAWRQHTIVPRYRAAGAVRMAYVGMPASAPSTSDGWSERRAASEVEAVAWLRETA